MIEKSARRRFSGRWFADGFCASSNVSYGTLLAWRRRRSPLQSAVKSGSGSVWQENRSGLSEDAEKVPCEIKSVPQRLKPRCEQSTCGTAEAVPLSKTGFFSSFFSPWSLTPDFP